MNLFDLTQYTESPIESKLAFALAVALQDFETANIRVCALEPREFETRFRMPAEAAACIIPQARIDLGDTIYRVDFLLLCGPSPRSRRVFAIECDGHEWHEKTKAQAARDKLRDRRLLGDLCIPTVRFTGSEIVGDPEGCAEYLRSLAYGATGDSLFEDYLQEKARAAQ